MGGQNGVARPPLIPLLLLQPSLVAEPVASETGVERCCHGEGDRCILPHSVAADRPRIHQSMSGAA